MQEIAAQLENIINQHTEALRNIPVGKMEFKPSPAKWSKKEIIGHMADSAQNNIRRFVVAQYETTPQILYNQDQWVAISNYQQYKTADLISFWQFLNKHIAVILKNTSPQVALRTCQTQELHTIEWLAHDYVKHLRHHLHQVLDLEEVAYP
jgi:hypothetical protein